MTKTSRSVDEYLAIDLTLDGYIRQIAIDRKVDMDSSI